jgi:hypothetical protein
MDQGVVAIAMTVRCHIPVAMFHVPNLMFRNLEHKKEPPNLARFFSSSSNHIQT